MCNKHQRRLKCMHWAKAEVVLEYIWSPGFCSVSECLVKCSNCGFLSGARLSGSLPCLHSLNAPLSQSFAGVWLRHKNTQDLGTGFSSDFCSQSGVFFGFVLFCFFFFPVIESRDFFASKRTIHVMCYKFGHWLFIFWKDLFGPFFKRKKHYIPWK